MKVEPILFGGTLGGPTEKSRADAKKVHRFDSWPHSTSGN
jgi:hypothetical protein